MNKKHATILHGNYNYKHKAFAMAITPVVVTTQTEVEVNSTKTSTSSLQSTSTFTVIPHPTKNANGNSLSQATDNTNVSKRVDIDTLKVEHTVDQNVSVLKKIFNIFATKLIRNFSMTYRKFTYHFTIKNKG